MRLGAPIFETVQDPKAWAAAVRQNGYRAAYCPVDAQADAVVIQAYADAAAQADIVIAEVGAWSNPLSTDEAERSKAIAYNQQKLGLAEQIGAVCCVNIAGSCGPVWDGPHPQNLTRATFDQIVETVRTIIDAVQPTRAFYTLEPMPWMYPDSPDSYLQLIRAIDRPQFAAHLDPVNMICSPQRYFGNAAFLRDCFAKLGPYIKSCHAKDIRISDQLTTHLDEVRPGLGYLDYRVFLQEVNHLPVDTPFLLEHLQKEEEYRQSAEYVRSVARELQIDLSA